MAVCVFPWQESRETCRSVPGYGALACVSLPPHSVDWRKPPGRPGSREGEETQDLQSHIHKGRVLLPEFIHGNPNPLIPKVMVFKNGTLRRRLGHECGGLMVGSRSLWKETGGILTQRHHCHMMIQEDFSLGPQKQPSLDARSAGPLVLGI